MFPGYLYLYTVASILRELLNEDVVERLIRHEAQPSALSDLETTSEFNNSPQYTSVNGALTGL